MYEVPVPPPPAAPRARERYADAHLDRVVLVPTADTHPEGTVYLSFYDIAVMQLGYALTDRTQLSVTAVPLALAERVAPLDLSLKTTVVRAADVRVAAMGSVSGIGGLVQGPMMIGRVGGAAQFCLSHECQSHLSMASNLALVGPALLLGTGVGGVWRVSRSVSLLAEVETLAPLGKQVGTAHGIAAALGLRLPHRTWALDFALQRPVGLGRHVPILPWLIFTYRWLD